MIRIVEKEKEASPAMMTEGQIRTVVQMVSRLLGIVMVESRVKVIQLLQEHDEKVSLESSDQSLTEALINQLSKQNPQFIQKLTVLVEEVIPALKSESHDQFVEGVEEIGKSTASGAAGGGIVGAAMGLVGGIFGFASTAKQEKIEKDKASAMTLSSLLQYKSAKLQAGGSSEKAKSMIIMVVLALIAIVVTLFLIGRAKKQAA